MTGAPAGGTALDPRGLPPGYSFKPEYEITPREAREALTGTGLLLVDVRTIEEWNASRVPGSMHVPLHELEARFGEIEDAAEDADRIAFLCHHGVRSMKAALFARQRGLENAVSVAGGIDLWALAADAEVKRYERGDRGVRVL